MLRIILIVASRFRSSSEHASLLLENLGFDSIFFSLPEELGESLNLYSVGDISEDEFWNDYTTLTGLSTPFANALRYKLGPLINKLPSIKLEHDFEIYCFENLQQHIRLKGLTERQLLLEFKSRATGKLDADEWRIILREELETGKKLEEKIAENILEKAMNHKNPVVICAGFAFVKNLKSMLLPNYEVRVICLEHYWKPPLDVLKTLFASKGIDKIPYNIVMLCIKNHLKYLNYILHYDNVDTAHTIWSEELKPHKTFKRFKV
ncbi:MAG: hypothetical protein WED07_07390 [Candidatus Freyarchaeum deiterrae]